MSSLVVQHHTQLGYNQGISYNVRYISWHLVDRLNPAYNTNYLKLNASCSIVYRQITAKRYRLYNSTERGLIC